MPACGATRRGPVAIKSLREPSLLNGKAVHAESLAAIDVPMVLERAFPRSAGFRPLVKPLPATRNPERTLAAMGGLHSRRLSGYRSLWLRSA